MSRRKPIPLDPTAVILGPDSTVTPDVTAPHLDSMILSASGWRTVFAKDGDEESATAEVRDVHAVIAGLAARVFCETVKTRAGDTPIVAVGQDTRPTGTALAQPAIRVLLDGGINVRYLHVCATPEVLTYVRGSDEIDGFFYVTASHNPIGHNGFKMGFADGSVAGGDTSRGMIERFRDSASDQAQIDAVTRAIRQAGTREENEVIAHLPATRAEARQRYRDLTLDVVRGPGPGALEALESVKQELESRGPGIVIDFNGSARTRSIDRELLSDYGCRLHTMNDTPGEIAHQIVPEGAGLRPCLERLTELSRNDGSFFLGYVPDNDGDRGNLVVSESGEARQLEAQEVFALSAVSELSWLVYTGAIAGGSGDTVAVVANGPTSMRIERIAALFGAAVFRAEVGEANVVNLARSLRNDGYLVRFFGEGSNGGNITHPSTVRDPLLTVFGTLKLLFAGERGGSSPLRTWLGLASVGTATKTTMTDLIASLPVFTTTSAFSTDAKMQVRLEDHHALKTRVEELWIERWADLEHIRNTLGVSGYRIENYEGTSVLPGAGNRSTGRGGFKILLHDENGVDRAFLWMRGSGTEPVFRVMVDIEGDRPEEERQLLTVLRELVTRADSR